MNTEIRVVAVVIAVIVIGNASAQTKPREISVEEGRQLLYRSLRAGRSTRPPLAIDHYTVPLAPSFYFFTSFKCITGQIQTAVQPLDITQLRIRRVRCGTAFRASITRQNFFGTSSNSFDGALV